MGMARQVISNGYTPLSFNQPGYPGKNENVDGLRLGNLNLNSNC
jgi:hypothetical protein